jgi:hypothetical protein
MPLPNRKTSRFRTVSLPEVVVDAVDLRLPEDLADLAVEPLADSQVVPNGFSMTTRRQPPSCARGPGHLAQLLDDSGERRRLVSQVVQAVAAGRLVLVQARRAAPRARCTSFGSLKSPREVDDPLGEVVHVSWSSG